MIGIHTEMKCVASASVKGWQPLTYVPQIEFFYVSEDDFVALHHEWYVDEHAPLRKRWFEGTPKLSDDELRHWYHQMPRNALWMGINHFVHLAAALQLSSSYFVTHDSCLHPDKLPTNKITFVRKMEGHPKKNEPRVDCYLFDMDRFDPKLIEKWDRARRISKIKGILNE